MAYTDNTDNLEKRLKDLLGELGNDAKSQGDLKKNLFGIVFSEQDINACVHTVIDVALGSVARMLWAATQDGHPSQTAAFHALAELRRHWRLSVNATSGNLTPPPISVFKDLQASKSGD